MKPEQTVCTASVWPHRHTDELTGPLDIKISYKNQPPIVRDWPKKRSIKVQLAQPDDRTNLTIIQLAFMYTWRADRDWHNINQYRIKKSNSLTCYLKTRITKTMQHPIPRGRWEGTCVYDYRQCTFTFQAMTMQVQTTDEPKIILPDGSLPASKRRIIIP